MIALAGSKSPLPARDERGSSLRLSSRGGDLAHPNPPLRQRTAWHESGHAVASRAMDFPISCATVEPNKWFSGRCLAPLSRADDSPEQQIAAAQAICDQARALIGNTLGQDRWNPRNGEHTFTRGARFWPRETAPSNSLFRALRRSTMGWIKP
jgi:hypothetical protein